MAEAEAQKLINVVQGFCNKWRLKSQECCCMTGLDKPKHDQLSLLARFANIIVMINPAMVNKEGSIEKSLVYMHSVQYDILHSCREYFRPLDS